MLKHIFAAGILLGLPAIAPPVQAQALQCADRQIVADRLTDGYSEQLIAGGLQNSRRVVEVWASPETGTFTIVMTTAEGLSCVVASGTNFHQNTFVSVPTGAKG